MDEVGVKMVVLVSKRWDNPTITVGIAPEGLTMQMTLDEFITALALEVGSPAMLFSQEKLRQKLQEAADKIRFEMQAATAPAMAAP